jgi:hypothetical protein
MQQGIGKEKKGRAEWRENERLTNGEGRRADRISKRRFATSRAPIVTRERKRQR